MYIYGIINSNGEEGFGPCGITAYEEVYSVRDITEAAKDSKISNRVYTIPYQDIYAVVSDSQFVDFTTFPKDQVARYLLRHQQVIEKIMDTYTIIPMKLGTYAFNLREVEEILSKGYAMFKDIFRKVNNKIEMDVVATWSDLNSIIKEIGREQDVKKLKEESMSKPEGVSAKDQIRIGNLIKNILDNKRERCALEIETGLKDVSIDFRKHDLMDDRMIFNIAFLIDKNKKTEFERRLDELDAIFNEKLNFRCVGPLPAYSFYTLEIKKMQFEEIEWARKKLGLNNFTNKEEIKKAYHRLAFSSHPDRNPDILDSDKEFNEVNKAYKLLLEYCPSAEQAGPREEYSLREEEFAKNAIIVKVRD